MPTFDKNKVDISFNVNAAIVVVALCFFIIAIRLWYLQILNGEYFGKLSENNRLRTVFVPPPRGLIFDRNGKVMVKNRASFDVDFVAADAQNPKQTVADLATLLETNEADLWKRINNQRKRHRFEPKILLKDVSRDVVAKVAARRFALPGVLINVSPTRDYMWGDLAAHALGYIREISQDQLENPIFAGYRQGDLVGQSGVELKQEHYLRGDRGVKQLVVNAIGTRIGEESFEREKQGHNLRLTIDLQTQQAADEALKDRSGAVVALDPNNGEVLALASSPRFDPNLFTREITPQIWTSLRGPERRLNNRAVQGAYPPGSVFKVFMAVAGLAEGVMKRGTRVHCPGYYQFGRRKFRCHKESGHGSVDLFEAMAQSCDVYFYTLGQLLGIDRIHEWSTRFGLGELTEVDLPDEKPGLIPSTAWKRKAFKRAEDKKWYPGETPSVAIGQGAVTTTPIQIARSLAAVVNGGDVLKPHLIREIFSSDGKFKIDLSQRTVIRRVQVDKDIMDLVRNSMVGVVNDPRGTGRKAQLDKGFGITVGGKTGTAQVVALAFTKAGTKTDDHAWFAGYAPVEKPEIVVVALIENGGHGGSAAAPVVRTVMEAFFRSKGIVPATPTPTPVASAKAKPAPPPVPTQEEASAD